MAQCVHVYNFTLLHSSFRVGGSGISGNRTVCRPRDTDLYRRGKLMLPRMNSNTHRRKACVSDWEQRPSHHRFPAWASVFNWYLSASPLLKVEETAAQKAKRLREQKRQGWETRNRKGFLLSPGPRASRRPEWKKILGKNCVSNKQEHLW